MSDKEDKELTATMAGCLIAIVAIAAGLALNGWALMTLWGWFVVPFGLPAVGLWHALGLSLLGQMLTTRRPAPRKGDETGLRHQLGLLAYAVLVPLLALGLGWCAHQLMSSAG